MPTKKAIKAIPCYSFLKNFPKQKLGSLYYIFGLEEYLKTKAANLLIDRAVPPEERDFDLILFYGDEMSAIDAIEDISTKPFLADQKVIYIKQFDKLKTTDQQKIVEEFLKVNKGDNILIATSEKFDSRLKLSKLLLKEGEVIECKRPYKAEDMLPWLNEEVRSAGKRIDPQAALLFVNKVELDFNNAANELQKLMLYCHKVNNISLIDVQICTGDSKTYNIFDFINNVGEHNVRQSFIIMENLLENREAPILIITMLIRFFVQLWRINTLRNRNCSDYAILSNHLKDIHQFFRKNYLRYAANYPLPIIPEIFSLLLETDTELKSVNLDDALIVERMLFRLFALVPAKKYR